MPKYSLPGYIMRELAQACRVWAKDLSRAELIQKLSSAGADESTAIRIVQLAVYLYIQDFGDDELRD